VETKPKRPTHESAELLLVLLLSPRLFIIQLCELLMACWEVCLPLLFNLNDDLSASKRHACRQIDLKPVNGVIFEDFAASSAAALSLPGVQSVEAGGVHMPKTPSAGVATQPEAANTGQPHLPGSTPPASEAATATAAARKRQAPIAAAQEGPSVPTTVASQQDGVTGVGGESGGPATTQPAQRRRKMQDSRVAAVIDLDDSSSEGGVQARQQQAVGMTDDAPGTETNAICQSVGPDKR